MYIRRKVFSLLDVDGEERYFSTTDFELTDDYGYEDRYYSDDDEKRKGLSKAAKAAIASGASLATLAGGVYAGKKGYLGKKVAKGINAQIMKHTKQGSKLYEGAVDDIVNVVKRGDRKSKQWVAKMAKENPSMDKGMKTNISKSIKDDANKEYAEFLRKKIPGRKPKK